MPRGVINRIFKTKLAAKLWLYMVLPTLVILLFIGISISVYFNMYSINSSINEARIETSYVASSFSEEYTDLTKRFVRKTSSADFKNELKEILGSSQINYTKINNALQNVLTDYTQMNNMIASVLIEKTDRSGGDSLLFYSYNNRLKRDLSSYYTGLELSDSTGITLLPHSASPFTSQPEVIPIVIPLKYIVTDSFLLIAEDMESTDIILYIFLSTAEVNNYLELYCKDSSQGVLYLVDASGRNMSRPSGYINSDITENGELSSALSAAIADKENYFQFGSKHVNVVQINNFDLFLVNIIPHEAFTSKSDSISMVLVWIAIVSIILITGLSFMISLFVTRPLKKLMGCVHDIKTNTYNGTADITSKDEIGQLSESIDSMYNTIQQQILSIKQEEKEKYHAKMQLLSEQINPHFLYNALEFINMEVYNNHTENASSMISSLGDYLRISLAYGENLLMISQELEQVKAYVNIMNYRFHHKIQVTTQIPQKLLYQKIIKCIMQPIVENSLKHGFKIGSSSGFPIAPMIDITMTLEDDYMRLIITDNGAGIDIGNATQIMLNKHTDNSSDRHLGLNNIYQRLTTFYGDVDIEFQSIPFFENKVIIRLPAHFFQT